MCDDEIAMINAFLLCELGATRTVHTDRKVLIVAISVILSLSAGVGEELLFRGALQPMMSHVVGGNAYFAIGLSSILFGALHAATIRYFLLASILSAYLGFLQIHYSNIAIPILVHTFFDIVAFLKYLFWDNRGKAVA